MSHHCEVAILGPSSSFKTRTGLDIKDGLDDACILSIGSVFRKTAEKLNASGLPFDTITSEDVKSVLTKLHRNIDNGVVTIQNGDGSPFKHNNGNGTLATNYAENPAVQTAVIEYVENLTKELHQEYSIVIFEGRRPAKKGLNLFLTAPIAVRREIKKIECDVAHLSDEEIVQSIVARDLKDTYKETEPLRIPRNGIVIRHESMCPEEHKAIVDFSIEEIRRLQEHGGQLPQHQVVYTYNAEAGKLLERIPTYR